ncbi:FecR family protein, partial [Caulobacter sp.]|uniref:FecR family protein n=1 Tax=Caulobacter sp. TaxID=78 RepID=UPI003BB15C43
AFIGGGAALAAGLAGLAYVGRDTLLRVGVNTAVGERRTVTLPDGSSVELNTDTRLAWRFDGKARKLWLDRGEAALTIAVDDTRPFLLMAAQAVTHLTSGQFNARLRSGALDLIVLAGRAAVRTAAGAAQAEVSAPGDPRRVLEIGPSRIAGAPLAEAQAQNVQAWRRGEIVFDGQPLSAAVEEYNRYLTKKIVIGDPSVGALRLGGRFLTGDPESFLTALKYSFGLRIIDDEQSRILLKTT